MVRRAQLFTPAWVFPTPPGAKLREGEEWRPPLPSPENTPRSAGSAPPLSSEFMAPVEICFGRCTVLVEFAEEGAIVWLDLQWNDEDGGERLGLMKRLAHRNLQKKELQSNSLKKTKLSFS